ncbi:hypothetical protein VWM83_09720, partial [Campylobacter coli]
FFSYFFDCLLLKLPLLSKFIIYQQNYSFFMIFSLLLKSGISLTSNIGNTSIIGNEFLVKNPDYDFFIDVSARKTLSFRANGKI